MRFPPSNTGANLTIVSRSFDVFGSPSKGTIFVRDAFKWVPKGYGSWIYDIDKSPGMVKLRENRKYAHEVASKLVEEKRQELKDGTSRKDLLSLLGSSCVSLAQNDMWYDDRFFSQGKFHSATRLAIKRRRNYCTTSVRKYL